MSNVVIPSTIELPRGMRGDKWALLCQLLVLHTALSQEWRQGHWVNLHSKTLRKLLGRESRKTIDELINEKVIEVNERYSVGDDKTDPFCKSYRFTSRHRHGRMTLHRLTYRSSSAKVAKIYAIDEQNLGKSGMHFLDHFRYFEMDWATAAKNTKLQQPWDQWTISRWSNRQEFAKRCDYRRFHSLLTQTPRGARQYLRLTNRQEPLALVDVSACQPLLLGALCRVLAVSSTTTQHRSYLPYVAHFSAKCNVIKGGPGDVERWITLCEEKGIYRHLHERLRAKPTPQMEIFPLSGGGTVAVDLRGQSLSAFKKCTLIPFFDRAERTVQNPVFKMIEEEFPSIARFILDVKRERDQGLACLLQRAESDLMIDGVGNRLLQEFPMEPVGPIHDALLVRAGFAEVASELIRLQFGRLGVCPAIKIEMVA